MKIFKTYKIQALAAILAATLPAQTSGMSITVKMRRAL